MKITYDREAGAMYIKLLDTEAVDTQIVGADGNLNANVDADGRIVGIEFVFVQDILDWIEDEGGIVELPERFPATQHQ